MSSSLKQVLVHLDATLAAPLRLSAARQIAQQHGAALAALYATVPVYLELPYAPEMSASVAAALVDVDNERRAATRKMFDETMRTPGSAAKRSSAHWARKGPIPSSSRSVLPQARTRHRVGVSVMNVLVRC